MCVGAFVASPRDNEVVGAVAIPVDNARGGWRRARFVDIVFQMPCHGLESGLRASFINIYGLFILRVAEIVVAGSREKKIGATVAIEVGNLQ